MTLRICNGDLLDQDVEVIVNAWNRNLIPWWLLLPQRVSGAIKRRAGYEPFRELARHGPIPLGGAARTGAGRLPFRAIIHVAGINLFWRSSERAIRGCIRSALGIAREQGYRKEVSGAASSGPVPGRWDRVRAVRITLASRKTATRQTPQTDCLIDLRSAMCERWFVDSAT